MISRLNDQHHISPAEFGDLTYPQLIAILTGGNANKKHNEAVRARKTVADFRSGKLRWDD